MILGRGASLGRTNSAIGFGLFFVGWKVNWLSILPYTTVGYKVYAMTGPVSRGKSVADEPNRGRMFSGGSRDRASQGSEINDTGFARTGGKNTPQVNIDDITRDPTNKAV